MMLCATAWWLAGCGGSAAARPAQDRGSGSRSKGGTESGTASLPSQAVIDQVPIGDVPGVAASTLIATLRNPYADDSGAIQEGHELYIKMNCADCHGFDGKGGMGPNLTDKYWRFGGAPVQIYKSVYDGRSMGMPAWGKALPAEEIWKIVAYIQSLGGAWSPDEAIGAVRGDLPGENVAQDTMQTNSGTRSGGQ